MNNDQKMSALLWLSVPLTIATLNLLSIGGETIWQLWAAGIISYAMGTYQLFKKQTTKTGG